MKFGSDPRKLQHKNIQPPSKVETGLVKGLQEAVIAEHINKVAKHVLETHAATFRALAAAEAKETPIVNKSNNYDKLARKHSRLTKKRMEKSVDELSASISNQDELFHSLKRGIHNLVESQDKMMERIQILEARKPEEIRIVTEKTVEVVKTHKLVVISLVLSLALNALVLLVK